MTGDVEVTGRSKRGWREGKKVEAVLELLKALAGGTREKRQSRKWGCLAGWSHVIAVASLSEGESECT